MHTKPVVVVVTVRVCMWVLRQIQRQKREKQSLVGSAYVCTGIYLHVFGLGLTLTGLESLKPPVTSVSVAATAAVLKPSTARSATTASA